MTRSAFSRTGFWMLFRMIERRGCYELLPPGGSLLAACCLVVD